MIARHHSTAWWLWHIAGYLAAVAWFVTMGHYRVPLLLSGALYLAIRFTSDGESRNP